MSGSKFVPLVAVKMLDRILKKKSRDHSGYPSVL